MTANFSMQEETVSYFRRSDFLCFVGHLQNLTPVLINEFKYETKRTRYILTFEI